MVRVVRLESEVHALLVAEPTETVSVVVAAPVTAPRANVPDATYDVDVEALRLTLVH